jgi:hypothetical protein
MRAVRAFDNRATVWIKVVLSSLHRLVARRDEVLRNREARELLA